jgi:aryl-alcohol dehydrogenase-like predicted oxidoreductase
MEMKRTLGRSNIKVSAMGLGCWAIGGPNQRTSDGRTMAPGALAWIWAHSERTIPIPGFKNVKQVIENAKAMVLGPFTETQMAQIKAILQTEK